MKLSLSLTAAAMAATFLLSTAPGAIASMSAEQHVRKLEQTVAWLKTAIRRDEARLRVRFSWEPVSFRQLAEYARRDERRAHRDRARQLLPRFEARLRAALDALHRLPLTGDWQTAVRVVQRVFPGSSGWLLACSSSEGGHGGFVWRGHGRGGDNIPGGWMQYMPSTWRGDFDAALAYARQHGWKFPAAAASHSSPLGQALAAGWAYGHNRPPGKWTGARC